MPAEAEAVQHFPMEQVDQVAVELVIEQAMVLTDLPILAEAEAAAMLTMATVDQVLSLLNTQILLTI
jgi:hypothetical protein